ncbi:hypothetical protein AURDEDRAFT_174472 [Auricularia subglabra TFB-10046 SS5]|uniref:G-protein coupled receptors family 1 profile domain-containing protein n=1 Tax=Auricularia subglabra (strain TFB-10046 / SS5) TaxID=717982 RepID=J0CYW1_AURST|nr:hypothetical protein AURDEDRAFT_174472 [Auricularia subglabra TFB-10046 SS5]
MLDAASIAFFVLTISGGQVLLPVVLATCILSRRVHRHALFLELLACFVVYSLATCVVLYAGRQGDPDVEGHPLCLAQAALVNGSLIMTSIAAFCLILHLRLTMPLSSKQLRDGLGPLGQRLLSCAAPLAFLVYEFTLLGIELSHPGTLQAEQRDLICGFRSTGGTYLADRISPIIIGVFLLASLAMSSFMFTLTFSARKGLSSRSTSAPWMRVVLRFTIFAAYAGVTAIACMCRLALPDTPALHTVVSLYVATLPLAAFFVFGTLPDVLEVWHLRKRQHETQTDTVAMSRGSVLTGDPMSPRHIVADAYGSKWWTADPAASPGTGGQRTSMSVGWEVPEIAPPARHPYAAYPPGLGPADSESDIKNDYGRP